MKAMLCCECGLRLEASGDDGLVRETLAHRSLEHPYGPTDVAWVRDTVEKNSYRLEYAVVYAEHGGPDEEFGPEPY